MLISHRGAVKIPHMLRYFNSSRVEQLVFEFAVCLPDAV